jgi:hypothetical protein
MQGFYIFGFGARHDVITMDFVEKRVILGRRARRK